MIKLFIFVSLIGSIHGRSLFKRQSDSIKIKDVVEEITNEVEKALMATSEKQLILFDMIIQIATNPDLTKDEKISIFKEKVMAGDDEDFKDVHISWENVEEFLVVTINIWEHYKNDIEPTIQYSDVKVAYQNIVILGGTMTKFINYPHEEKKEIIYGIFENMDIDELNEFTKVAKQIKASNPLL
ncbi:hypothetical protein WR25_23888 isoform B [Diploscapter pachys]|uniref:SXP/RAL-2 family protein Ani s 5-like cation-binding domain-containing protein n=1 Tax=Diploscapter pachys TaxID=2018661 RepID=A0A2A2L179_9BILA|nr:hypothetical protein WR25_23888 isoform B [Diploscapter pachys]